MKELWTLIILFLLFSSRVVAESNSDSNQDKTKFSRLDYEISHSCVDGDIYRKQAAQRAALHARSLLALKKLQKAPHGDLKNRLAVMILFSEGFGGETVELKVRENLLKCSLLRLQKHFAHTPTDIYVWVQPKTMNQSKDSSYWADTNFDSKTIVDTSIYPSWALKNANDTSTKHPYFANVYFMPLEPEGWLLPCHLPPKITWAWQTPTRPIGYYQMGRWRLVFTPSFIQAMGYRYFLQVDDDTILHSELPGDIVQEMKRSGYVLAVNQNMYVTDSVEVVVGLVEHAKQWMNLRNAQPQGDFWDHVHIRTSSSQPKEKVQVIPESDRENDDVNEEAKVFEQQVISFRHLRGSGHVKKITPSSTAATSSNNNNNDRTWKVHSRSTQNSSRNTIDRTRVIAYINKMLNNGTSSSLSSSLLLFVPQAELIVPPLKRSLLLPCWLMPPLR